jgi:hypothetical protein
VPIPQQEQKCIVIVAGEESASEHNMAMVARAETKIFVGKSNLPRNGLRPRNRKERNATQQSEKIQEVKRSASARSTVTTPNTNK